MTVPISSRAQYQAAIERYSLAGAALAIAREDKARAAERLTAAEDDYMDASAALRAHEAEPGIPLYTRLAAQQDAAEPQLAAGDG